MNQKGDRLMGEVVSLRCPIFPVIGKESYFCFEESSFQWNS